MLYPMDDAMAELRAYLPAADATRVYRKIDQAAHTAAGPGDGRTMDQRRADTLTDLILNPTNTSTSTSSSSTGGGTSTRAVGHRGDATRTDGRHPRLTNPTRRDRWRPRPRPSQRAQAPTAECHVPGGRGQLQMVRSAERKVQSARGSRHESVSRRMSACGVYGRWP